MNPTSNFTITTTPCSFGNVTNKCVGTLTLEPSEVLTPLKEKSINSPNFIWQQFPNELSLLMIARLPIPDFLNLSQTNASHYVYAREYLLNKEVSQFQLCPKLTILNPFNIEKSINLCKMLQWYHKLEPTVVDVEDDEKITLQIRPKLPLTQWIEIGENQGVKIVVQDRVISASIESVVEEGEAEWEMISNAPVTKTHGTSREAEQTRVVEMGYHQKPSIGAQLHLIIFTQKVFGKYLCHLESMSGPWRTSTGVNMLFAVVNRDPQGHVTIDNDNYIYFEVNSACGLRKMI